MGQGHAGGTKYTNLLYGKKRGRKGLGVWGKELLEGKGEMMCDQRTQCAKRNCKE